MFVARHVALDPDRPPAALGDLARDGSGPVGFLVADGDRTRPARASASAVARPMPLPAPVMTATAPSNERIGLSALSATGPCGPLRYPLSRPHRPWTPSARRSTTPVSSWARRDTAAVVTSAEPWKVPGNWCSSTDTPAWSIRSA